MYKKINDPSKFRLAVKREIKKNTKIAKYLKRHFVLMAIFVKVALENRKNKPQSDFINDLDWIKNFKFK